MAELGCNYRYNITNNTIPYTDAEIQVRIYSNLVLAILSTFANVLVMITFIVDKSIRTTFNIFIFNLAIVDLLTSIFRMGFKVLIIADLGLYTWPYTQAICDFNGTLQAITYVSNIYLLMAIAVCRYIAIVLSKKHLVTKRVVHIIMIIIWIGSLMVSLAPVFGWNRYCYLPYEFACTIDPLMETTLPTYIIVTEFIIPMIILIVCYTGILRDLKRNSDRMRRASSLDDNNSYAMRQMAQREARVTIGMFILFLAFVVCLGPYTFCSFVLVAIFHIPVSRDVMFFSAYMVNVNSLCNPIIYAIWQEPFREAYCRILCCCCPKYIRDWCNPSDSNRRRADLKLIVNYRSPQQIVPAINNCPQHQEEH